MKRLEGFFTERQAGKLLNLSPSTLKFYRACKRGPEYQKEGRFIYYTASAIERFQAGRKKAGK